MKRVRVLFIDLDGTVRHGFDELGRFVNGPDDVVVFPGVKELLRRYKDDGWRIVGVTNQGGIALGHADRDSVLAGIRKTFDLLGAVFDKISICVHHPDATDVEMALCWCRKPRVGGIIEILLDLARANDEMYPPYLALFVGDRPEDRGAADNLNVRFMDAKEWRATTEPPAVRFGK